MTASDGPSVLLVGPGTHFLSGVSQYVARLGEALDATGPVAILLLRRLCPVRLYPGRHRVGQDLAQLRYPDVPVLDGVDWYWGRSMVQAVAFLRATAPDVVVLQWWTGTVAHTYLLLAHLARRRGARIVLEFHEVLDVGEAGLPLVGRYVRALMRRLIALVDGVVVHSAYDAQAVHAAYQLPASVPVQVVTHGPYDHYVPATPSRPAEAVSGTLRLLYAGVVRPYKGLEDLAEAMRLLDAAGDDVHLTVVGEVWQGYRTPVEALERLPGSRVTVVEGYVSDEAFAAAFDAADVVVLPYRRSSASGPLHVAMSRGLPVVTTAVGGLSEAATAYTGAVLVPPSAPAALADGIRRARALTGRRHEDVASWETAASRYADLLERVVEVAS